MIIPWPALLGASASIVVGALFAGADTAVTSLSPTHLNALIEQATGKRRAAFVRIQEQEPRIRSRYLVGRIASTAITSFCFFEAFEPVHGRQYFALAATILITATLFGMALGGWMSGAIFDVTGSYRAAFVNGLMWNLVNVSIVTWLLRRSIGRLAFAG